MNDWRFIPLEIKDGYWNMALDESILKAVIQKKTPYTIRFYKWNPSTVSIGRNQSLTNEVNIKFCKHNNFNIVRRITGGGAVFHDQKGEITYSIVCSLKFLKDLNAINVMDQYELITDSIIFSLSRLGLNVHKGVINCPAIFLDDKKFSGNAQIRRKGFILQHGTILLKINADLMYSALKTPPNISQNRMVRSVKTKCIGIKERLDDYKEEDFINSLKKGFEETLNINTIRGQFSKWELKLAEKLVNEKYINKTWLRRYE